MAAITTPHTGEHEHGNDEEKSYLEVQKGLGSWLYTLDHKRIGVMYLISVLISFLIGGIFALVLRIELYSAGKTIMDQDTYNRMFSLHGVVMVLSLIHISEPTRPY